METYITALRTGESVADDGAVRDAQLVGHARVVLVHARGGGVKMVGRRGVVRETSHVTGGCRGSGFLDGRGRVRRGCGHSRCDGL
jgi:hypothetical protein